MYVVKYSDQTYL